MSFASPGAFIFGLVSSNARRTTKKFLAHIKGNKNLQKELNSERNAQPFLDSARMSSYELSVDGITELGAEELKIVAGVGNGGACTEEVTKL
ncbi:hypothetical protein SynBIOSE41_02415 [Synechococcus sp. BIOS-E4-1]|uniref:Nif11-like leader peptide family natural product precursor n=1 Tax=Synechococcus sp. BIOS-E4-1 TaxID=1400864 RepID=UPI00164689B4|nr:Nif11-like leader peptide family natural product precursor [Synechococcus sp. BIOS-E4-1]QNI54914.1 hypothetical protein SynBIOSE41_02415 [Synechococcus sp. BIOS-E4-1]